MTRALRVLNVYSGNLYGGIESMLVTLARSQPLCPSLDWGYALCFEGRLAEELREARANVMSLGAVRLSRPWTVLRARRRLREILRTGGWDAAICHGSWPYTLAAPEVRRAGRPLIYWAHGPHGRASWLDWWANRRPPDLAIANSRATLEELRSHVFPTARAEVVYCPVSAVSLGDVTEVRRAVRADLDANDDAVVLITSCRLERWKGHSLLLDALERLADVPNWRWWIAGGAQSAEQQTYLNELTTRVRQLGFDRRVRFLGQRADVPRLLVSADVHCQPNTGAEPFGIAFVEALYAGLPVVTTALGGAKEIVDETCGILVPTNDPVRLSAELKSLIADGGRRRRLGSAGPARAVRLSDPASRLRDVQRLLETLR